jgi:uncharacterized protein YjdB
LASCRLDDLVSSNEDPTVELELTTAIVGVADSVLLTATVLVNGEPQEGVPLSWRTGDSDIATVTPAGLARGQARGRVVVGAQVEGGAISGKAAEASDTLWVVAATLALSPAESTLTSAGDTLCFEYEAQDAGGAVLAGGTPSFVIMEDPDSTVSLTPSGTCVVGRVSGQGATIQAILDTARATAAVTVRQTITALEIEPDSVELLSIGATEQILAEATDRRGNPVPATLVTWTSNDTNVVVVDSTGELTARGAGEALVHGESDGLTDSAVVSVTPPDLSVTPTTVSATAKVGSAALQTTDLSIDNEGTGSPSWSGSKSRGWLSLSKMGGAMPDVVQLSFDPAGLAEGTHHDTVVITVPGASGSPAEVPVTFELTPCSETGIAPDVTLNSAITTSDCGAPHRSGSFARVYTVTGGWGDTVSLRLEGDFDSYLVVTDGSGTVLAENDECPGNPVRGPACIDEFALPASGTYRIEATSFDAAATGNFTLRVTEPTSPAAPAGLAQFRSDGTTPIAPGGVTSLPTVALRATVSDTDPADSLWLQVEVRPLSVGFTGAPTGTSGMTTSGSDASVTVAGLPDNTSFHWQARAIDQTGRAGNWVSHGSGAADFHVDAFPDPPNTPTGLSQFRSDGTTPIPEGGQSDGSLVRFRAVATDPDPVGQLWLEIEYQLVGVGFTGTASVSQLCSADPCEAAASGLPSGAYHWQARVRDNTSPTPLWSGWDHFGSDPDVTHFIVP